MYQPYCCHLFLNKKGWQFCTQKKETWPHCTLYWMNKFSCFKHILRKMTNVKVLINTWSKIRSLMFRFFLSLLQILISPLDDVPSETIVMYRAWLRLYEFIRSADWIIFFVLRIILGRVITRILVFPVRIPQCSVKFPDLTYTCELERAHLLLTERLEYDNLSDWAPEKILIVTVPPIYSEIWII